MAEGERIASMSVEHQTLPLAERVRALAGIFVETDLLRLTITREHEQIELGRRSLHPSVVPEIPSDLHAFESAPVKADLIKSDLVGIFHFGRPAPAEGDLLESDRELAYIEALGIRNPVRSLGAGRILSIKKTEGEPVEYGAVLFEIDRG
jgi:biotin carboxyl carrier protein